LTLFIWVCTNVISDYISLFIVRGLLIVGRERPLPAMIVGPIAGACLIFVLFFIRDQIGWFLVGGWESLGHFWSWLRFILKLHFPTTQLAIAALAVHIWLPFLALCLVLLKVLNFFREAAGKAQWLLNEGEDNPLDAVGYVAATIVFLVAAIWLLVKTFVLAAPGSSPGSYSSLILS
jgi:hypothetical protein